MSATYHGAPYGIIHTLDFPDEIRSTDINTFVVTVYAIAGAMLALAVYLRLRHGPFLGYKLTPVQKFRWQISAFGLALASSTVALYMHATPLRWAAWTCCLVATVLSVVQFTRAGRTL